MNKKNPIIDKLGEIDTKFTEEYYNSVIKRIGTRKALINISSITSCMLIVAAVSITAVFYKNHLNTPPAVINDGAELIPESSGVDSYTETSNSDPYNDSSADREADGREVSDSAENDSIAIDTTETQAEGTEEKSSVTETETTAEIVESKTEEVTEVVELDLFGGKSGEAKEERYLVSITQYPKPSGTVNLCMLEEFFKDEDYFYSFPYLGDSNYVIVKYSDGSTQNVKEALNEGNISMSDLDAFGISYFIYKRIKRGSIKAIVDHSLTDGKDYMDLEETFYSDYYYCYYFKKNKSHNVTVYFENGEEIPLPNALNEGSIDIEDLDTYGIEYFKKPNPERTNK